MPIFHFCKSICAQKLQGGQFLVQCNERQGWHKPSFWQSLLANTGNAIKGTWRILATFFEASAIAIIEQTLH